MLKIYNIYYINNNNKLFNENNVLNIAIHLYYLRIASEHATDIKIDFDLVY